MDKKIKDNILGKLILIIWVILFILGACGLMIDASTNPTTREEAEDNQYFELTATRINNVNGRQTSNNGIMGI